MDVLPIIGDVAGQRRFVAYTKDKVPLQPWSGSPARVNSPETWTTLPEARAWAELHGHRVGVVAGDDLLVLDFDGAVEDGAVHPWAKAAVAAIGCEVEVSVSGTGLHGYVRVTPGLRALVTGKRQLRGCRVPIRGLDLLTGNHGVILGTPLLEATRSPEEQAAAVAEFLGPLLAKPEPRRRSGGQASGGRKRSRAARPEGRHRPTPHRIHDRRKRTGLVLADWNLVQAANAHGKLRTYLAYLRIKVSDREGTGRVPLAEVEATFTGPFAAMGRKHPSRAAQRLLDQVVDAGFARVEQDRAGAAWLRLAAPEAIAARYGVELGKTFGVQIGECLSASAKQAVYLGRIACRDGLPTTRASRKEIAGASANTQRTAERKAGVPVEENYVLEPAPSHRKAWLDDGREARRIGNSTTVRDRQDHGSRLGTRLAASDPSDPNRVYFFPELGLEPLVGRRALVHQGPGLRKGQPVVLWRQVGGA